MNKGAKEINTTFVDDILEKQFTDWRESGINPTYEMLDGLERDIMNSYNKKYGQKYGKHSNEYSWDYKPNELREYIQEESNQYVDLLSQSLNKTIKAFMKNKTLQNSINGIPEVPSNFNEISDKKREEYFNQVLQYIVSGEDLEDKDDKIASSIMLAHVVKNIYGSEQPVEDITLNILSLSEARIKELFVAEDNIKKSSVSSTSRLNEIANNLATAAPYLAAFYALGRISPGLAAPLCGTGGGAPNCTSPSTTSTTTPKLITSAEITSAMTSDKYTSLYDSTMKSISSLTPTQITSAWSTLSPYFTSGAINILGNNITNTTATPNLHTGNTTSSNGLSPGAIAGITIGSVALATALCCTAYCIGARYKKRQQEDREEQYTHRSSPHDSPVPSRITTPIPSRITTPVLTKARTPSASSDSHTSNISLDDITPRAPVQPEVYDFREEWIKSFAVEAIKAARNNPERVCFKTKDDLIDHVIKGQTGTRPNTEKKQDYQNQLREVTTGIVNNLVHDKITFPTNNNAVVSHKTTQSAYFTQASKPKSHSHTNSPQSIHTVVENVNPHDPNHRINTDDTTAVRIGNRRY